MNVSLSILTVLRNTGGLMIPKATLLAEVRLLDPRPTIADIAAAMNALESSSHIVGIANVDAAGGSRWKITDAGMARLAEANL